jgi:outer membrane protein assembly factor BamB
MPSRRDVIGVLTTGSLLDTLRTTGTDTSKRYTDEDWVQYGYDPANTAFSSENTGPEKPIDSRWTFDDFGRIGAAPSIVNGTVFVSGRGGEVRALSTRDGSERWRTTAGGDWSSPAVHGNTVYLGSVFGDYGVTALSAQTGSERWRAGTDRPVKSSPTVADDTVYVGDYDDHEETGTIYAFDAIEGTERWRVDGIGITRSALAVADDTVFAAGRRSVHALSQKDGTEQWRTGVGDSAWSAPAVSDGTVFVGTKTGRIVAISADDGTIRWESRPCAEILTSPAVDESTVYIGGTEGTVSALSTSTGESRWSVELSTQNIQSLAVVDGTVYAPSILGSVYALSSTTGAVQWKYDTGASIQSGTSVADETVYVGNHDGELFALSHGDPDGLFGEGLFTDPLSIGVGTGVLGLALRALHKLIAGNKKSEINTEENTDH